MPIMLLSREKPLVSTEVWYLWKDGQAGETAAMGVLLILVLVVLTVVGRWIVDRTVRT
jgi:ABC-type Fe3+ transport system permease subunit